jgi:uncharacterized membrane protein
MIGLLLVFGTASFAEAISPVKDVFYQVAGVASNDVLNIRAQPTSRSEIIGVFHYNHPLFEVTGSNGRWVRVNLGEYSGWVHSGYIQRVNVPTFPQTNLPNGLKCHGEEPFWTVTLSGGRLQLQSMTFGEKVYAVSTIENIGDGYLITGMSKTANEISILVEDEMASSSIVENYYNWSVSLEMDGYSVLGGTGCGL